MNAAVKNSGKRVVHLIKEIRNVVNIILGKPEEEAEMKAENTCSNRCKGTAGGTVQFSNAVLDDFRRNAGRYRAESGGMLASSIDENIIDRCYFDTCSKNTSGTFYYDVESMSEVFRDWKSKGYITNGIYHSHPRGCIRPSYHDISTALLHIRFFKLNYFYLPILQPEYKGFYTMYFYIVREKDDRLIVDLSYVIEASEHGYEYAPFTAWNHVYSISELESYRESIDKTSRTGHSEQVISSNAPARDTESAANNKVTSSNIEKMISHKEPELIETPEKAANVSATANAEINVPSEEYFKKIKSLYPDKVLDKVLICIGTGGARSFLENCARNGFRNYILIDKDVVSPSNIATQGVFISEMGKKKVDVIRDRIMDINPDANVICVDRFLDDTMSDEEFKRYMDRFPNKKPTDYLILGCTDNFDAQKRSSMLALKYGTPYLAAMMYEAGAAAEIVFVYPGVTESCPRCLLRDRFEKYENGFQNDVDSSACTVFATERMNATKGYIALMMLMYHEDPDSPLSSMLDHVKDRNFVWIRLDPNLKDTNLGIGVFDSVLAGAARYTYMDETLWIPQHPDNPQYGSEPCKLCGGDGNLKKFIYDWKEIDTREIRFAQDETQTSDTDSEPCTSIEDDTAVKSDETVLPETL